MSKRAASWERLRKIRTLPQLFDFFIKDLGWPIDVDTLVDDDLEDITFEWAPEELGISKEQVSSINRLRQMQPIVDDQPWGIFFVEIEGQRLPITQLRRLLQSLVTKKRAIGSGANRSWDLDDLLFVVTTDVGDSVELHLLAFFESEGHTPEVRSLPWRPAGSPVRHLQRLANELLPRLSWPEDESNLSAWREAWRSAFNLRHGETIKSAARLAERMATTAADLRVQIAKALKDESGSGPFSDLLGEVRRQLVANVDTGRFADMCAQTLVYGVLSSRVTDPQSFGASPVFAVVPLSNPFLAAFFEQVHDQAVALDLEGSGLEQLVADLRVTNVEAILDQFGSTAKGGDPVIHFYEEFLKRYDSKMRADAGAFYTPQPVVEFMVRAVDQVLRSSFGLAMGTADPATWAEVGNRNGFDVPTGVDPSTRFVSMVEPAAGTGTFLVEWLRQAKSSFLAQKSSDEWPKFLSEHILPSLYAFELMLGPYAIGHLKLALELHGEGLHQREVRLLLTDTLDHEPPQLRIESLRDPVALEGEIAARVKREDRFTIVIGNPPYDREQKQVGDAGKRKGGVVRYGAAGMRPLLDDVIEPMRNAGLGVHIKNVYNDYVYFWRWAAWQSTELPPGPGVVAFITAASYLDGVSMGGLRALLRKSFDEFWIIDLGGEGRGALTEENVFDIRTPVAIGLGVRRDADRPSSCLVRYKRVSGNRLEKFNSLRELQLAAVDFEEVGGEALDSMVPRAESTYASWAPITRIFPLIFPGVKAGRTWVIGPSKALLTARLRELLAAAPRERERLFKNSPTGRKAGEPLGRTNMVGEWSPTSVRKMTEVPSLERYGYRSFDRQYVVADPRFLDRASAAWAVAGGSQIFLTTLTSTKLGRGPALTITPYVPDLDHFRGSYGAKNVMPLYRDQATTPNLTTGFLEFWSHVLGKPISAEDVLAYVHAILGTPAFHETFSAELSEKAEPVRVPLTADPDLFSRAVAIGRDLVWWHTWGARLGAAERALPKGSAREITSVRGYPETFLFDTASEELKVGSGVYGPVSEQVWDFEVSGLKVVSSWLGYRMASRKGRKSSPLDDTRPSRWTFSDELLQLLGIIEHTLEVTPEASELISIIGRSPLVDAESLPSPTYADMKLTNHSVHGEL